VSAAYTFLPWLRTGIATKLEEPGAPPPAASRPVISVGLQITGEPVPGAQPPAREVRRDIQLYGPGDIVGVDPRAISRVEPRPWTTNVEPNYLAHIEFYEEDLPWRYSPDRDRGGRLTPWLALVVLAGGRESGPGHPPGEGDEFRENAMNGAPLPSITVLDPARSLPPPDELGAWAHLHVNGSLGGPVADDNTGPALAALAQVQRTNADNACSRLLCPRHLAPDTAYHAFLVPAFETGRLAGLGLPPAAPATMTSWGGTGSRPGGGALPYYHRWFFTTGAAGDFEYLVRLLDPQFADENVGRREIDVHRSPGFGLPGIEQPTGGILKLGGALKADRPVDEFDKWAENFPHPFQTALAKLINLADDYLEQPAAAANAGLDLPASADPVITPPLYGRWHALTSRLLTDRDGASLVPDPRNPNWVHELNLDPRYRVAANFGTQIVQARQEELMAAAWEQVGDVLAANAKIRAGQLHREVGFTLQGKHLEPAAATDRDSARAAELHSGKALTLTAPVHARLTQRAAPTARADGESGALAIGHRVAVSRVATAAVSPAMRRITRPGSRLIRRLFETGANTAAAARTPGDLLTRMDAGAVRAAAPKRVPSAIVTPAVVEGRPPDPDRPPPNPVPALPQSGDFALHVLGAGPPPRPTPGGTDNREAQNFKDALNALYGGWPTAFAAARADAPEVLGVEATATAALGELRADVTVLRTLAESLRLPPRLQASVSTFTEVLAHPVFDLPMYEALRDLSVEAFVPNLGLVPPNTITLLLTDQAFIEAFMVGLNHELARELLWREYPTDQRGTPFRQFWDPRRALDQPRERLYDIKPIHLWSRTSRLGQNDNRDQDQKENLVMVIRGELLKKYPNAAVYAHKARWQRTDGVIDPSRERVPVDIVDPNAPDLVREIRLPVYEARVDPDIQLLGFDLSEEEAEGTDPGDVDGSGWFFVIKERPGDPRFGIDEVQSRVEVWNDLSWPDVDPTGTGFITFSPDVTVTLKEFDDPRGDEEKAEQRLEDLSLSSWQENVSAADVAYILFQAPVLMAVHAQEMLPRDQPPDPE
jgi:hypothetical protein